MLKQVISQGGFAFWPQLSLVIFTLTFLAILVWVSRKKASQHYQDMANLAIEDSQMEQRHDRQTD